MDQGCVKELTDRKEDVLGDFDRIARSSRKILVVAGPSGVGKGTLLGRLRAEFPRQFAFAVSHTSRQPREGEKDGVHYYFVEREKILDGAARGLFLEHADVFGNVYGTSLPEVLRVCKTGDICLLEIDVQGVRQIQQSTLAGHCNFVFIDPPADKDALERRLRGRGTETEATLQRRVNEALRELSDAKSLAFEHVVNDDLDVAYTQLKGLVARWYPGLSASASPSDQQSPQQSL